MELDVFPGFPFPRADWLYKAAARVESVINSANICFGTTVGGLRFLIWEADMGDLEELETVGVGEKKWGTSRKLTGEGLRK